MTTFHTGFSSLGVVGYERELERGGDYGVDFVELTMNTYPAEELSADADRIRALADEHGLELLAHLPFGAGTIDFETILTAVPDSWEGTLTLEIDTSNYDYIEFSHRQLTELLDRIE